MTTNKTNQPFTVTKQKHDKKIFRRMTNKHINKWIEKSESGDYHDLLVAERSRRAKKLK